MSKPKASLYFRISDSEPEKTTSFSLQYVEDGVQGSGILSEKNVPGTICNVLQACAWYFVKVVRLVLHDEQKRVDKLYVLVGSADRLDLKGGKT